MSGITGLLYSEPRPHIGEELRTMNRMLAHRGPDGEGSFVTDSLGLGHRHLAVMNETVDGTQPLSVAGQRYWIVFDGQLYNGTDLRRELLDLGQSFTSNIDAEVFLAAYLQWGEACQLRLNGMWAVAIWDAEERSLFLSRDRFGEKPLYYVARPEVFAFASEMKAFLPLSWFEPSFNQESLALSLRPLMPLEASERCLFRGVTRLRPGYSVVVRPGRPVRSRRWWNTLEHRRSVPHTLEAQVEEFRELFIDACSIRARSDAPVGATLSGGLDSSSIICALDGRGSAVHRPPGDGATLRNILVACFPGCSNHEAEFAEQVAAVVRSEALYADIDSAQAVETFDRVLFSAEEINDPHLNTYWLSYRALRRAGVVVSLDGLGGDELLAGYPWQVQTACIDAIIWPGDTSRQRAELKQTLESMFADGLLPEEPAIDTELWHRLRAPELAPNDFEADRYLLSGLDALNRQLYYDFHCSGIPGHLRKFDHCSMAHGVESRSPFLDWRLVCYCFSLPSEAKISHGYTKYLLREAMRRELPTKVRERKVKIGFSSPLVEWLKGPFKPFVRDLIHSRAFLESNCSQGPLIRDHVERCFLSGDLASIVPAWSHLQASRLDQLVMGGRWREFLDPE